MLLAFFHVPVYPEHRKYLSFLWNGRMYQFQVLCFGVKNAPFAFVKLGEAVRDFLFLKGIRMIIYLDDILILAQSISQCIKDAQFVIDTLVKLGFFIKRKKCVFTPSQHFFFLGYLWDTKAMLCTLPQEKLENIQSLGKQVLAKCRTSVKELLRLSGLIIAARPAVPMTRARHRGIQRMVLKHYNGTKWSGKKMVYLSAWARKDIMWWNNLKINHCQMSLRSIPVWESVRVATDAMDTAIGSIMEGRTMYEVLDNSTVHRTIAHKEWLAFERTIMPALSEVRGKVITWHVDNMNVRQAWLNSGTVRDLWLCEKVVKMQQLLHDQGTLVIPVYVRSAQHLHADLVSRDKVMPDWKINPVVTDMLFKMWGVPEIDLMATYMSRQVPKFYSALMESQAEGIDALTKNWNLFSLAYVFPPPPMMELILNRIFQCSMNTRFILISPWKPKAQWFPKALALATQSPVRLPLSWKTVVDMARSGCFPSTPSGGKIKFAAWMLSGKAGPKLEDCPLGLSKLYSRAGRIALRQTMEWASATTQSSVEVKGWTSLPRLQ